MTESARATYTLSGLLDQFVLMGGPSIFGPGGLAILTALWRRSQQLGWANQFVMSHAEITVATGIRSRGTISAHCDKLQEGGYIQYLPPPKGKDGGKYTLQYKLFRREPVQNLNNSPKPVQILDNYNEEPVQKMNDFTRPVQILNELNVGPVQNLDRYGGEAVQNLNDPPRPVQILNGSEIKPVQKMDNSQQPVQLLNDFLAKNAETRSNFERLLKDTITTITTSSNKLAVQNLDRLKDEVVILLQKYTLLHNRVIEKVKDRELLLMISLLAKEQIPLEFILSTMQETFGKYSTSTVISSFCYYEGAIRDGWQKKQFEFECVNKPGDSKQEDEQKLIYSLAEEAKMRHATG
ncbi:hypothetical protein D3C74_235190 [compost metagenome]